MKNKIIKNSIIVVVTISVWFTILFDPTNFALGTKLFTLPSFMLGLAEIMGNTIWILGLIFFISGMLIIFLLFNDETLEKNMREGVDRAIENGENNITPFSITNKKGNVIIGKFEWWHKILFPINVVIAIIAMGSGFWFTGTIWLFSIILLYIFRKVSIDIVEEIIKEEKGKDNG